MLSVDLYLGRLGIVNIPCCPKINNYVQTVSRMNPFSGTHDLSKQTEAKAASLIVI
jgi:hypothetical protein